MTFSQFRDNVYAQILYPGLAVLFAIAMLLFLWGVFNFIRHADDQEGRDTGKKHMIWGVVGMTIMVCAYAIVKVIGNTVSGL